jgi:hypothetical protein
MLLRNYFDKMTPENRAAYHAANKKISDAWERGFSDLALNRLISRLLPDLCEIGQFLISRNWGDPYQSSN